MRRWFKLFMRRRTVPIAVPYAEKMKENLAILYCFFAWNAAGLYAYYSFSGTYPMTEEEKKQPARYYARIFQTPNAQVINMRGLTVTDVYKIEGTPKLIPDAEEFQPKVRTELCDEAEEVMN